MNDFIARRRFALRLLTAAGLSLALGGAPLLAQQLAASAIVDRLRGGGHVIVMRHASSPRVQPDAASAAPGNVDRERQLDALGQDTASAMGAAIRRAGIPIGEILSSPTFRGMQTAELLNLGATTATPELGDGGQGMREDSEGARSSWLRRAAAEAPAPGTNRLLITHTPNLVGAFGDTAAGIAEGESLILMPEAGRARVLGRIRIEQWPELVAR